jgi:hypothetical protein
MRFRLKTAVAAVPQVERLFRAFHHWNFHGPISSTRRLIGLVMDRIIDYIDDSGHDDIWERIVLAVEALEAWIATAYLIGMSLNKVKMHLPSTHPGIRFNSFIVIHPGICFNSFIIIPQTYTNHV